VGPAVRLARLGGSATLAVEKGLTAGLAAIRRGEYFAAHEELEDAWRAAPSEERDFYQGLVHVAVAWYQAGRGNRVGCERQLEKAARRLGPFAPEHRAVDVASILEQVETAKEIVAAQSLELPPPRL
jgi:predicted metal-dependent hydrolase